MRLRVPPRGGGTYTVDRSSFVVPHDAVEVDAPEIFLPALLKAGFKRLDQGGPIPQSAPSEPAPPAGPAAVLDTPTGR